MPVWNGPVTDLAKMRADVDVEAVLARDPSLRTGVVPGRERTETRYVVGRLRVERVTSGGQIYRVKVPVLLVTGNTSWASLLPGQRVRASGRLVLTDHAHDEVSAVFRPRGKLEVVGSPSLASRATEPFRAGLRHSVENVPEDARGLVPGLVIGDESLMSDQVRDAMRTAGLSHLTAVSGSNIAIVLLVIVSVARWLGLRSYALPIAGALGMSGFVMLARPDPSVLRAAAMGIVAVIGLTVAGRRGGLSALLAAVSILLLIDPWLARSVGFALSVLATTGILVFVPAWQRALSWLPRPLRVAIAVPLAAQVACTPMLLIVSGQLSLASVPANMLAAPAVPPATVLGVAAAFVSPFVPALASVLGWLAALPAWWIVSLARWFTSQPSAVVPWPRGVSGIVASIALTLIAVLALPVILKQPVGTLTAATLLMFGLLKSVPVPGWPPTGWLVVACDVGQGDALVLRSAEHSAVVVDAGPDPGLVRRCLDSLHVSDVPLLLLTHFDTDHVAGVSGVLTGRNVAHALVSPLADPAWSAKEVEHILTGAGIPTTIAHAGDRWSVSDTLTFEVIWPRKLIESPESESNNASVVISADVDGIRVLLTGDLEPTAQRALLRAEPDLTADVLKVPHHGSSKQETKFITGVDARLALISVGDNTYGHPSPRTLDALRSAGIRPFRTDLNGSIAVVHTDHGGLGVIIDGPRGTTRRRQRRQSAERSPPPRGMLSGMVALSSPPLAPVTLIVGPEALLAERAVNAVVRSARTADANADVSEVDGRDLTPGLLAEHISPSLLATRRVLVVHHIQDVSDAAADVLVRYIRTPISDIHLVLVHPGGVKGKKLLAELRKVDIQEIPVEGITRSEDHVSFVLAEVRRAGGRSDDAAARQLVEAVGGDLRALASAAAQLTADAPDGAVTSAVVSTYFEGRAEVKGWVVADRAVEGKTAEAVEQLRWALETGTDPVLITGSLAAALRSLGRLAAVRSGRRDVDVAKDLGVPPWKVRVLRAQLRGWSPTGLAQAIRAVADADLAVKGAGNDATLALTTALVAIGSARAHRR
jgi:competence protein ComEC